MRDNLAVLQLGPNATWRDVKRAYRELARVWHPDRFPHDNPLRDRAERKTKDIIAAYEEIRRRHREGLPLAESYGTSTEVSAPRPRRWALPRVATMVALTIVAWAGVRFAGGAFLLSGISAAGLDIASMLRPAESSTSEAGSLDLGRMLGGIADELDLDLPGEAADARSPAAAVDTIRISASRAGRAIVRRIPSFGDLRTSIGGLLPSRSFAAKRRPGSASGSASKKPALVAAAVACDERAVEAILSRGGADPDVRDEHGNTALSWAARLDCLPVARLLARAGADRDARSLNGYSPLAWARWQGSERMLEVLGVSRSA